MAYDGSESSKQISPSTSTAIPEVGSVYWCYAPYKPRDRNAPITPGPDPHPVLVMSVYDEVDPPEVLIAPGTGTLGGAYSQFDFEVTGDSSDAQAMGLTKSTRFKLSSIDRIPFSPNLFVPKDFNLSGIEHSKIGVAPDGVLKIAREKYSELIKFVERINRQKR